MYTMNSVAEWITFPDGTPHCKTDLNVMCGIIDISIRSADDLVRLALLADTFQINDVRLHYVMGGRMDRRINLCQPHTLKAIAKLIRSIHVDGDVWCVFPHSPSTLDLLGAMHDVKSEREFIEWATLEFMDVAGDAVAVVLPDSGSEKRYWNDHSNNKLFRAVIPCTKMRDMSTGKLSGFRVNADAVPKHCLILDDLCDGGRTFSGIADKLREIGAETVGLAVYHGIFSQGTKISGINAIYTTNSFRNLDDTSPVFKVREVVNQ